jgi:hypothetical protein
VTPRIEDALPFWLDRPDEEALDIALEVGRTGLDALWIGEMATFDAISLATAVGQRVPGLPLKLGPLAIGVRSRGFRLRRSHPDMPIAIAASGPAMTGVAARQADEVVLNLVPPEHVASVRAAIDSRN